MIYMADLDINLNASCTGLHLEVGAASETYSQFFNSIYTQNQQKWQIKVFETQRPLLVVTDTDGSHGNSQGYNAGLNTSF